MRLQPEFPPRKLYTEQMFVSLCTKRMQLRNHADTQPVKRSKRWKGHAIYTCSTNFGMLEVRENMIALRKLSGGTAQLRTSEGTLLAAENVCPWKRRRL